MIYTKMLKQFDRTFWMTFLYEAAFFGIAMLIFIGWNYLLNASAARMTSIETATISQAGEVLTSVKGFVAAIIISSIVAIALQFANWVMFESIIWNRLTGKTFSSQRLKDFSINNLQVIPIYLIIMLLFSFIVLKNLVPAIQGLIDLNKYIGSALVAILWSFALMPAIFYLANIHNSIYLEFYRTGKIAGSIGAGFKRAFSTSHYKYYVLAGIVFAIIAMLLTVFSNLGVIYSVLSTALFLLLFSWLKTYTARQQITFIHQEYLSSATRRHKGRKRIR